MPGHKLCDHSHSTLGCETYHDPLLPTRATCLIGMQVLTTAEHQMTYAGMSCRRSRADPLPAGALAEHILESRAAAAATACRHTARQEVL